MTRPIAAAVFENPSAPIASTQSGEKITPPMLPPLYTMPSGRAGAYKPGRDDRFDCSRAHLAPARAVKHARNQELPGVVAVAQPNTPSVKQSAPAFVTLAIPQSLRAFLLRRLRKRFLPCCAFPNRGFTIDSACLQGCRELFPGVPESLPVVPVEGRGL